MKYGGVLTAGSPLRGREARRIMVGMDAIHLVGCGYSHPLLKPWPTPRWSRWTPHQGVRYCMSFFGVLFRSTKWHIESGNEACDILHCSTSPQAVYSRQSSLPELVFEMQVSPNYHPQICYTFVGRCWVRPKRLAGDRSLASLIGRVVWLKRKAVRCPAWGIVHTACAMDLWAVISNHQGTGPFGGKTGS